MHPEANIIFGAVIDDTLGDEVRVTVIAAGFDGGEPTLRPRTRSRRRGVVPAPGRAGDARRVDAAQRAGAREARPCSVGAVGPDASYDSAFGDDDLDIPDFLK